MPITDKLTHVGAPGTITSLQAPGKAIGATSINIGSATNWPTDTAVYFAMRVVNSGSVTSTNPSGIVTGTYTEWKGTVSGTVISNLTLVSGTDQVYAAGSNTQVYIGISAAQMNSLIDALLLFANQDGSLKSAPVKAALGITSGSGGGWDILNAGTAPTVASGYNKGNKEYTLTFNGVDLTSTLSAGMRLKFDRGTTAPTQSMSFTAASSQYATKASPTGITFTSAFTCEAWVYLNSYAASDMIVISRSDNSTGGFGLTIKTTGQIDSWFWTSDYISYQSLPLKRWVHVAGVRSGTTGHIYLNGVEVPGSMTGAGSTFTQVGPLNIGAINNTSKFFDGYISEARVWSAAQTATQIADNMAISLTGSETNLVALFQGNGNFTDKTANGNTLTATGGAIATQTANPYNTTEYAIVTKVAYATSTTTVTVFTGTDYNIPLGTLINPFSSFQKAPFGWPASRGKWLVECRVMTSVATNIATNGVWVPSPITFSEPTGEWELGYSGALQSTTTGAGGTRSSFFTLSSSTPSNSVYVGPLLGRLLITGASVNNYGVSITRSYPDSVAVATVYTFYVTSDSVVATEQVQIRGDQGAFVILAVSAYA